MRAESYLKIAVVFTGLLCVMGCAGTIKTHNYYSTQEKTYNKVYVVAAENSQFIRFKPGIILPMGGYIVLRDDPAVQRSVIGNTDQVIKTELERYGYNVEIVHRGDLLGDFDFLVEYHDTWRWDFKKVLDRLEIYMIASDGRVIAKSLYKIFNNKELHNFPTPNKEVPKMVKALLSK